MNEKAHSPFTQKLRNDLVRAGHERRLRRVRAFRTVGSLSLVLLVGLSVLFATLLTTRQQTNASVLAISESGGVLTVNLREPTQESAQVTKELRARGIAAKIVEEPVAQPQVGSFLNSGTTGGDAYSPLGTNGGVFTGFTVKRTDNLHIEMFLGRAAKGDETYFHAFDLFGEGGSLRCANVWGQPLGVAGASIQSKFKSVQWRTDSGDNVVSGAQQPALRVVGATQLDAESVIVTVANSISDSQAKQRPDTANC